MLLRAGGGLGGLALLSVLNQDGVLKQAGAETGARANPLKPARPHFTPRAKSVIHLFLHGGPSHVDLFDPKPELARLAGQRLPESFGSVMTRRHGEAHPLLPAVRPYRPCGESGLPLSTFWQHLPGCADELCILRSCHGQSVNHPQAIYQMHTGKRLMGRPCLGSWVAYGLGTENQNMPAFVVMQDPGGGAKGGAPSWGSGFLPATYQGTQVRSGQNPILYLDPPKSISAPQQQHTLEFIQQLNARHLEDRDFDDELSARVSAYELAFRMQSSAAEVVDLSRETAETQRLYGIDQEESQDFGTRCLLARRMVERGVRFVLLYLGDNEGWDAHANVEENHRKMTDRADKPIAGLIQDLRRRGLLDDTLVVVGGEFGRMPMSEGRPGSKRTTGRDHNPWGFSVGLAGGGVRGGMAYGATDPVGLRAEKDKVHIHDLHATILHLLGMDHEQLTYLHNGRHERLTDVAGRVAEGILS